MDGPGVYKMALRRVRPLVQGLLADLGLTPDDVDWVVPHQASGPGLAMLPRLGFPAERTVNIIGQFGNCVAASIPMALAHLAASGRVERGQRVLLVGTGAGFSVAGAAAALVSDSRPTIRRDPMKPGEGTASSQIEQPGRPFGSIESSEEYVALLLQAVEETAADVGEDLRRPEGPLGRQREALQLVAYKLEQLHFHLTTGRRR